MIAVLAANSLVAACRQISYPKPERAVVVVAVVAKRFHQDLFGAIFDEGQAAGLQRREAVAIEVVDVDGQPLGRERQNQRYADVSGSAHHGQVCGSRVSRAGGIPEIGDSHSFSP